jgi:hypothetical protein
LGQRVSSAGRRVPQWTHTGRFDEVLVMVLRIRTRSDYNVPLPSKGVSSIWHRV